MALIDRSLISSFHVTPEGKTFVIHPEHLENEELEYELRIRGEVIAGGRRQLSARLRELIEKESEGEEVPKTGYSVPSEEIELCRKKIPILEKLLEEVTSETDTQNRYMSKHLHVEGRLNRIRRGHDFTDKIFALNETLSDLYHEFWARVNRRKEKAAPIVHDEAVGGIDSNVNAKVASVVDEREKTVHVDGGTEDIYKEKITGAVKKQRNPIETNTQQAIVGAGEINANFKRNMRDNQRLNIFDKLFQFPKSDGLEFLNNFQISPSRDPKLSENFRRNGKSISHIPLPPNIENNGVPFPNKGQYLPKTSSRMSDGMFANMHDNFGNDRRNSMPRLPRYAPKVQQQPPPPLTHKPRFQRQQKPQYFQRNAPLHQPSNTTRGNHNSHSQSEHSSAPMSVVSSGQSEASFRGEIPNNTRMEEAIISIASFVGSMVERLDSVVARMDSFEQRNRTFTVPNQGVPMQQGGVPMPQQQQNEINGYRNSDGHILMQQNEMNNDRNQASNVREGERMNDGHSGRANNHADNFKRVPIHKWNFYFTANSKASVPEEKDPRAFLKRLEIFRDAEDVTYAEIFQKFHYLLKGNALDWFTQYRREFNDWNELRAGFLKQYTTPLSKFVTAAKLASRRQQKHESATDYISSIVRSFDEMEVNDEQERVSIIQNGLLPDLRNRAMSRDWASVQEMSIWLRKTELADKLYTGVSTQPPRGGNFPFRRPTMASQVQENEVQIEKEAANEETSNVEEYEENQCNALGGPTNRQKNFRCFNCKETSHYFNDCDQPITRVFCFRCGNEGVLAPFCECRKNKEQPKNGRPVAAIEQNPCDPLV